MKCLVKSFNERNPYLLYNLTIKTANDKLEEGEEDVKSLWLLWIGLHMCYNGKYKKKQYFIMELTFKIYLSSDCKLQLVYMKVESLVIVD